MFRFLIRRPETGPTIATILTVLAVYFLVGITTAWSNPHYHENSIRPDVRHYSTTGGKTVVKIADREVKCFIDRFNKYATVHVDNATPSEGASSSDRIWLNLKMLAKVPPVVRWFVFYHECGHTQIEGGGTELRADVWATKVGVYDGWLTADNIKDVCDSWQDAPAMGEHPSGRRRCAHITEWFNIYTERVREADERSAQQQRSLALRRYLPKSWWFFF